MKNDYNFIWKKSEFKKLFQVIWKHDLKKIHSDLVSIDWSSNCKQMEI